ncbi:MAG: hypothetical protein R6U44_04080 [Archaeoglobaceae archaeon]
MGADLYLDKVDSRKYQKLKDSDQYADLFRILDEAQGILPEVPVPETPVSADTGVITIGDPDEDSPVLVTGNSIYTHMVLGAILASADIDCHILSVDTGGHTVDMSVVLNIFRGEGVKKTVDASDIKKTAGHRVMIIPGFAAYFKDEVERETGWDVLVGPVCGLELPMYLIMNWPQ